ncbi:MAG: molecular chaperone TorD family protein [Hydrogenobacter thermophilus]|uniref:TorD/DmsD family molecular chaperone n=1 Tax=Hydrogenobacter thermophilus TaxID=940 RepID=UPI0030F81DA2|nr:molecular chaperone TorD family protein [Hydrogenobacter thermophilus]
MDIYRMYIYTFLSVAFSYPYEEALKEVEGGLDDLSLSLKALGIDFDVDLLRKALKGAKERLLNLEGEWNALFSTSLKAPANETAYELEKAGRKAAELADIEGFYKAFGLEVKAPVEPDSLVAELEFMAYLVKKKVYLKEKGDAEALSIVSKAFTSFFRDHIGRWYRIFTDLLKQQTEEEYYKLLGELLRSFLDKEREGVDGIADVETYRKETLEGVTWKCGF